MEEAMIWRMFQFLFYMIPVLWSLSKDLIWEELSWVEIRTNYLFGKANAYDRANFLKRAVKLYEEILRQDPNHLPVFLNLGGLYYRREMYEKAIVFYERVIELNPKHYHGHYWLAMCYCRLERYYAAINTLEEVIELLPTFKDALNLIGECYEQIGESAKAEHYYLKAIGADPHGIVVRGNVLHRSGLEKRHEERMKH
jgi:tetratricopeptide (TPR) repeat protein